MTAADGQGPAYRGPASRDPAYTGPTGQAWEPEPIPPRRRVKRGWWWRWPGTALILLAEGSLLFVAIGGSALAWRAAQGPVDLSWLLPKIGRVVAVAAPDVDFGIGHLAIAWSGFTKGPDQPIQLVAEKTHVTDARAGYSVSIDHLAVDLSAAWAVRGVVAPRVMTVVGPRVVLRQTLPTATAEARPVIRRQRITVAEVLHLLAQPPGTDQHLVVVRPKALVQLRRLTVEGGEFTLEPLPDAKGNQPPTLKGSAFILDLTRATSGGVTGSFSAIAAALPAAKSGDVTGTVALETNGTLRLRAQASVADPARLMAATDVAAGIPVPAFPVTAQGDVSITPDLALTALKATIQGGSGQLLFGGAQIPIKAVAVGVTGDVNHLVLDPTSHIALGPVSNQPPPTITLGGQTNRAAPGYTATLTLKIDHVGGTDLGVYWPPQVAKGAQQWVSKQIKDGAAHDGAFQFGLTAPTDLSDVALVSASGQVLASGLTVTWLPPIPPMTQVEGIVALDGTDAVKVTVSHAQQGAMTVSNGSLLISKLSAPIQPAALTVTVAGTLADAIALINHPRLHLLSNLPVPFNATAGTFMTTVHIGLPLKKTIMAADVTVGVHADIKNAQLAKLLAGQSLTDGNFSIDATATKLHLTGPANLAAIPTRTTLDADFTKGPPTQVQLHLTADATATPANLKAAGLPTGGVLRGSAQMGVTVTALRSGRTDIDATATLPLRNLSFDQIGWQGGAGDAHATAHVALQGSRILTIDKISLTGAGTQLSARSTVTNGRLSSLTIDRLVLGRTDLHGNVVLPATSADPYVFKVAGAALDLSTPFKGPKPTTTSVAGTNQALSSISSKSTFQRHSPWRATVQLDRIIFGATPKGTSRELDRVSGNAADDGIIVTNADVSLVVPPSGRPSRLVIAAAGNNTRRVTLVNGDFGGLLKAVNAYDAITGGALKVDAVYDDKQADHPLAGTIEMDEFQLGDAPTAARMLQLMTLYGVADLLHGPGVHFKRMIAPFRLANQRLDLIEARAYSESLGLTAKGSIDLPRNVFDIQGTIVPAYFFNALLGNIPLIGKLFSPEKGGGLFAAKFALTGPIDNPQVHVNPLSLVTPGFLRGLFGKTSPTAVK
jgi:hypothetical protein